MDAQLIEKEAIDVAKIIPAETNLSEEVIAKLATAPRLGNEFKSKATITFNTVDGPMKVTTTVWSLTEKYIQLKSNVHIPIKCIIDVTF
jgi:hypothetical protein